MMEVIKMVPDPIQTFIFYCERCPSITEWTWDGTRVGRGPKDDEIPKEFQCSNCTGKRRRRTNGRTAST